MTTEEKGTELLNVDENGKVEEKPKEEERNQDNRLYSYACLFISYCFFRMLLYLLPI